MLSTSWWVKLSYQVHRNKLHWKGTYIKMKCCIFNYLHISSLALVTHFNVFFYTWFQPFLIVKSLEQNICSMGSIVSQFIMSHLEYLWGKSSWYYNSFIGIITIYDVSLWNVISNQVQLSFYKITFLYLTEYIFTKFIFLL